MSQTNVGVFVTLCHIDRGCESEILPDVVFVPESAAVRDSLLSLNAIREADDAEVALYEKLHVSADEGKAEAAAAKAEAAAAPTDAAPTDAAAAAAEAAAAAKAEAKGGPAKPTATDKLVG